MTLPSQWIDAQTGQPVPTGGVLALGNFDGVHLGHRMVATRAAMAAQGAGTAAYALTFAPHPCLYFQKDKPPFQLLSPRMKRLALMQCGLHGVLTLPFGDELAHLSPEAFITDVLIGGLDVRAVSVGFDYAFGAHRAGDRDLLRAMLEPRGIHVYEIPPLRDDTGLIVSSSRIRNAVREGQMDLACKLLGSPFTLEAIVEKGDQRGRTLGFPTANMALGAFVRPKYGVYAVQARPSQGGPVYRGVANVGLRPTVGGDKELLETFLFDFGDEIYGQSWQVEMHAFLRSEEKFASLADLQTQMRQDVLAAKAFFAD